MIMDIQKWYWNQISRLGCYLSNLSWRKLNNLSWRKLNKKKENEKMVKQ